MGITTAAKASRGQVLRDSRTMLGRSLEHMARYPSMTLMLIGMPILFLLLFVYVFDGTMGAACLAAAAGPTTSPTGSGRWPSPW